MFIKIKKFLNRCPNFAYILKRLIIYGRILISTPLLMLPIKNNKIVICNYVGKGYGDNGKYIVEEIIRQNLNVDIVWLVKKDLIGKVSFPDKVRIVKYNSYKSLYELATAKIWIDNCRKAFYPIKRNNQYYIQTWHGNLGIKKVEKDAGEALSKNYIYIAKNDSKMADLFISNGNHITNLYRNSFWYDGEILKSGSPRNDIMFTDKKLTDKKVREYFNINNDIKIVLYAPTFRKNESTSVYNLDYFKCISALEERLKGEWIFLIRLHPNISDKSCEISYNDKILNASLYDDMQELLSVADVLITDYSSSMFDFSLKKALCFIYAPDVNEYMNDRNFYFKLEDLPFPVAVNNHEIYEKILNFNEDVYMKKLNDFYNKQNILEDGLASKRVVEKIKEFTGIK